MKKSKVVAAIAIVSAVTLGGLSGCASCSRMTKDFNSDVSGGLDRTVKVYNIDGEEIAEYSGKMDLDRNDTTWKFDIYNDDGTTTRVIITNPTGTMIAEEN